MNIVTTILLTIFMLFSYSQTSWSYTVNGVGADTCGEILEEENTGKRGILYWQRIGWMNGYITGRNSEVDGNVGKRLSYKAIYFAVIKYCRDNPLKLYAESLNHVYNYQLK